MQPTPPFVNLFDPEFHKNPAPTFAALRTHAPVYWFAPANLWYLTRYHDVVSAFRNTRLFSSVRGESILASQISFADRMKYEPLSRTLSNWMALQDPPAHTRSRAVVAKAFTAQAVEQMRPSVIEIVEDLLDQLQQAGQADLVRDFADQIPIAVIAKLLGVPKADWAQIRQWTDEFAEFIGFSGRRDAPDLGMHGAVSICEYLVRLFAERRRSPQSDLVTALLRFAAESETPLDDYDLASACFLLLSAGHETTETLLASAAYLLLSHPEEREKLRQDPGLLKGAIEEVLRYEPPVYSQGRILTEDLELHGQELRRGQLILLSIAAANRDPAAFATPDRFDISLSRHDYPHIAFAIGPHHCLGAALARMEARVAIEALFRRLPGLRLEQAAPDWKAPNLMLHRLGSLLVSY